MLHNITWHILPGLQIAHVRIAFFSKRTTSDLEKALNAIADQHAQGIILDLRNDPGGLLDWRLVWQAGSLKKVKS